MSTPTASEDRLVSGTLQVDGPLPRWQRWLLPAIIGAKDAQRDAAGGTDLPRSLRDWVVDTVLFGFAVVVGLGLLATDDHLVSPALFAIDAVLAVPACLSLWIRRRQPLAVGWAALGLGLVSDGSAGAALVGLFTVAVHCAPRRTLQLSAFSVAAGVSASIIYSEGHRIWGPLAFWLVMVIAVVGFGLYVRARRELLLSLQERARRAEDEQQLRVREAQLAERARIAREMHDVLAHRISLLSVHAGALEFHPDATAEEIARAASVIRVSARAAQEELREVVGVLRAGLGTEDLQPPQPTIADLARLIEESRNGGMDISVSDELDEKALSPIIGRTVYRLIQEALTNVRKHAPGQVVTIVIDGDRTAGMRVDVVNRPRVGRSVAPGAEARGTDDADDDGHVGSGVGLVGLAERVTLIGGRLTSEVLPGGGFRLMATIPWSDHDAEEGPAE
ncbi:MAG: histidine kinase [Solirubrobacteraceae bacterium]